MYFIISVIIFILVFFLITVLLTLLTRLSDKVFSKEINGVKFGLYDRTLIKIIKNEVKRSGCKDFVFEIPMHANVIDTNKVIRYFNEIDTSICTIKDIELLEYDRYIGHQIQRMYKYTIKF